MSTRIMQCNCTNEFQDETYGKKMRVFNEGSSDRSLVRDYTCTICLTKVRR